MAFSLFFAHHLSLVGTVRLSNSHVSDISNQNTAEAVPTLPGPTPED